MIFRFGAFSLDTEGYVLSKGTEPVSLEPQVFNLLLFLAENRERVVSKDDLIEGVWEGLIVSDAAITSAINLARRAVADDGKKQAVIKTFPRRGFRFVAAIEDADEAEADNPVSTSFSSLDRPAIAVLPFDNLSADPEQEFFSDGITEDIITALSLWRSFPVIAGNSTFVYKGKSLDVRRVAEELGVRYVVEGSVRKAGNRVRVTAESGHQLWADRYDRDLEDIFDLQDELTGRIAAIWSPN